MIEVSVSNNRQRHKGLEYPFFVKAKGDEYIVIALDDDSGLALAGPYAMDPKEIPNWPPWKDETCWEILPVGTTITLTVK